MQYPPHIIPEKETTRIITFLKKTVANAGYASVIVATSGGIDSATSLTLAAKAFGSKNVHSLLLPSRQTHQKHIDDALEAAKNAKLPAQNVHTIPIASIIQKTWRVVKHADSSAAGAFSKTFGAMSKGVPNVLHKSKGEAVNQLRLANLAARTRMIVLYDMAKKLNALVVGTENRSEFHLGYFTRFGDEASDIEPIQHLYKTHVRQLATHLKVPNGILTKAPTAGLWSGQTDESELGFSYEAADPILYLHFDKGQNSKEVAKTLSISHNEVNRVLAVCKKNHFKHQVPHHL